LWAGKAMGEERHVPRLFLKDHSPIASVLDTGEFFPLTCLTGWKALALPPARVKAPPSSHRRDLADVAGRARQRRVDLSQSSNSITLLPTASPCASGPHRGYFLRANGTRSRTVNIERGGKPRLPLCVRFRRMVAHPCRLGPCAPRDLGARAHLITRFRLPSF
jgi:hypothetical protein